MMSMQRIILITSGQVRTFSRLEAAASRYTTMGSGIYHCKLDVELRMCGGIVDTGHQWDLTILVYFCDTSLRG